MDKNYDRYFKITEGNSVKVHSCGILLFRKLDEEPEFLILTKPNNNKKNIGLPKGHLETGETIIGAAKRELFEETGIKEEDYKMNDDFLFEDVILPSKHQ